MSFILNKSSVFILLKKILGLIRLTPYGAKINISPVFLKFVSKTVPQITSFRSKKNLKLKYLTKSPFCKSSTSINSYDCNSFSAANLF